MSNALYTTLAQNVCIFDVISLIPRGSISSGLTILLYFNLVSLGNSAGLNENIFYVRRTCYMEQPLKLMWKDVNTYMEYNGKSTLKYCFIIH